MNKTKKYQPTKNVGIAPAGATKAELVWLNLTPQTLKKILDLDVAAVMTCANRWLEADANDDVEIDDLFSDRVRISFMMKQAKTLASKAGWRRTHPK